MQLNITCREDPVKPVGTEAYFDRLQLWLKTPVTAKEIAALRRQCGHVFYENRPARFGQGYRQRIELKQPGDAALRWVADQPEALLNRAEVTVDFRFHDVVERDAAHEQPREWIARPR